MIDIFSVFIGSIIGGLFSLITTYIIVRENRKSEYYGWLREQKIDTYISIANALLKIDISVMVDDSCSLVLASNMFRTKSKQLYDYTEEHAGELELFLPREINTKIIHLKGMLYRIYSSKDDISFDVKGLKNKQGIAYDLFECKTQIINALQKDLINLRR